MKNLELVDNSGGSSETDVLIGADLYWLLVDSEVNKKGCFRVGGYQLKIWLVGEWSSSQDLFCGRFYEKLLVNYSRIVSAKFFLGRS